MKHLFMKNYAEKSILRLLFPLKLRKLIRKKLMYVSTNQVPPIKAETRKMLNNYFKEDVTKLSELLKKDLQHWTN